MSRGRKHGNFSIGNGIYISPKLKNDKWIPIDDTLEVVFKQMSIAGNRSLLFKVLNTFLNTFVQQPKCVLLKKSH
ncbi:hypothetical protein LAV73_08765 [Lysinibacillus xylanilyticus]|uniref:hypothetical protein n=1 Tax=Lysinibacillus xylanilyticus TaxID=582475 RepID=UPI002B24D8C6|nr:hypothetical protein [Lysinibacillus xylanilyticus]MEB2280087.1 hypothetical protein [Lysinibacillus xylanilyticus]